MNKLIDFVTSRLTAQQNQTIGNALMILGVVINLFDLMQNGLTIKPVPLLLTIVFAGIGFAYQQIFVRCPHCGDKLKGHKNKVQLPERCPNCNKPLGMLPK